MPIQVILLFPLVVLCALTTSGFGFPLKISFMTLLLGQLADSISTYAHLRKLGVNRFQLCEQSKPTVELVQKLGAKGLLIAWIHPQKLLGLMIVIAFYGLASFLWICFFRNGLPPDTLRRVVSSAVFTAGISFLLAAINNVIWFYRK